MVHSNSIFAFRSFPSPGEWMLSPTHYPALAVSLFGSAGLFLQIAPAADPGLLQHATNLSFTTGLIIAVIVLWRAYSGLAIKFAETVTLLLAEVREIRAEVKDNRVFMENQDQHQHPTQPPHRGGRS